MEYIFNKQSAKFIQNWPSFMKVMVKQILVCFFMPHSVHTFHCMAHRLELAVKNTVDTVNAVSHFRIFVDVVLTTLLAVDRGIDQVYS